MATDGSSEQIAHAVPAPTVEYRVARADSSGLAARSVDVVTVAQALHWFAGEPFFGEVRRVTVPEGVIAAWSYGSAHAGADVEPLLRELEHQTLRTFWRPERKWVDEHYQTIPFPFPEVAAPPFALRVAWTLRQLGAYLGSWSAVADYRRDRGEDPVGPVLERMAGFWGSPDATREVTWPLNIRVGRVE